MKTLRCRADGVPDLALFLAFPITFVLESAKAFVRASFAAYFLANAGALWRRGIQRRGRRAILAGALGLGLASLAQAQVEWSIKDLGTLGGTFSIAQGINDSGQVVGQSSIADGPNLHAFLYDGSALVDLGGTYSGALDINSAGQVIGSNSLDRHTFSPFIYQKGAMQDFVDVSGIAWGLNNAMQVVGSFHVGDNQHAFLYRDDILYDLGTLGGSRSVAMDINNSGLVVGGSAMRGSASDHAFLYRNRRMFDLGTLGGTYSMAYAINDQAQVVGESTTAGGDSHAFITFFNGLRDLGTLGGDYSQALGINNTGQVVGASNLVPGGPIRAFLYSGGVMSNLNSLAAVKAAAWELETANAINNSGQIVGSGVIKGETHAYLLTPKYLAGQCRD